MGGRLTRRQEQNPGRDSHCARAASAGRRVVSSAPSEFTRTVYMAGTSLAESAILFEGGRGRGGGGGGDWEGMIGEGGRGGVARGRREERVRKNAERAWTSWTPGDVVAPPTLL